MVKHKGQKGKYVLTNFRLYFEELKSKNKYGLSKSYFKKQKVVTSRRSKRPNIVGRSFQRGRDFYRSCVLVIGHFQNNIGLK